MESNSTEVNLTSSPEISTASNASTSTSSTPISTNENEEKQVDFQITEQSSEASTNQQKMILEKYKCDLCLDEIDPNQVAPVRFCKDLSHPAICEDCMGAYITHKINDSVMGFCPTITCPCNHQNKIAPVLKFQDWSNCKCVTTETVTRYRRLAESVLSFLCGGCHNQKTISVESKTNEEKDTAWQALVKDIKDREKEKGDTILTEFQNMLATYCDGFISVDSLYDALTNTYLPLMTFGKDSDVWTLFRNVLLVIDDPERRALLHLRHLRSRPRTWTPCCNREHCFRCRIKDFHEGIRYLNRVTLLRQSQ
jgi:hypothetical protein